MPEAAPSLQILRFGVFELDLRAGELHKRGLKIRLQEKPLQVLAILLEKHGEVVTREELRQRLWGPDTFVDFDHSLGTAINKLREALGDSAESPRFIETLPRHGYRFIGHVEPVRAVRAPQAAEAFHPAPAEPGLSLVPHQPAAVPAPAAELPPMRGQERRERRRWLAVVAVTTIAVMVVFGTLSALNVGGLRERLMTAVRGGHGAPFPKIESVAVLPLENLSGDPEQEYFADGMTEELITDLGKISALRVISRTSVMHYKGSKKTLPEIARELNVDAIVEGTVRRSSDRVRITANLLYAPTDRHLWSETYERDLRDVLSLQGEVARSIASQIRIKLTSQENVRLASSRPVNPEAYELYLRGCYEENRISKSGLKKSLEYFQKAIDIDPGFAPAYSGIADSYLTLGIDGFDRGTVVFPKAKEAALRAVHVDHTSAEAHASTGFALFNYEHDYSAAIKELETATRLNPSYVKAHHWYALSLAWLGRVEEAIGELEQARRLDPLSARINMNFVYLFYLHRQYDRAIAEGLKVLKVEPDNPWTHGFLGRAYFQKGMPMEAFAAFQRRLTLQPNFPKAEEIWPSLTQLLAIDRKQ